MTFFGGGDVGVLALLEDKKGNEPLVVTTHREDAVPVSELGAQLGLAPARGVEDGA